MESEKFELTETRAQQWLSEAKAEGMGVEIQTVEYVQKKIDKVRNSSAHYNTSL